MAKFYAIKKGRKVGVYTNWTECKMQIDGFRGAIYKSFSSYEEAKKFLALNEDENLNNEIKEIHYKNNDDRIKVYVDGSYSDYYRMYSYGVVILYNDEIIKFSGKDKKSENLAMRNVAGELLGAIEAIKWALKNRIQDIEINYDYEGIEKWATGEWKTNKEGTKKYKEFIDSIRSDINVYFVKVKAHTGIEYNEQADKLAKSEFLNIENNNLTETSIVNNNPYIEIFNKFIKKEEKSKSKTRFSILFNGLTITESKLKKIAKEIWKINNKNIDDIEKTNIELNIEKMELLITIKDIYNVVHIYNICLKSE
ncbi:ribonuclease H family protein [Clostridium neonatale]|uniref:ribonuclease H family protein n=1 Tax=Clostridium neonatale TaxID=137838 RepID=UPI002591132F|nr:ribonuclease H family protein [Clostridium neonatale]CAI3208360.1 ribonuclease H-related protein [Clostridium neonatale]CAI3212617.1 ribonuclease H-related protein [Clostridium neonatale]CAI3571332.1 ribonuclease H-related protein [Clostridium neonatale]